MKEHKIIAFTRTYCRARGLHYQIRNDGRTTALYLYSIITGHYIRVCYDLLNLTEDYVPGMIDEYKNMYFCV